MSDREEFEKAFPMPLGVKWCDRQQDYTYENYRALDVACSQSGKWQAWQAARAQQGEGREPVAWATKRANGSLITASTDRNAELEWAENYVGATVIPLYTHPAKAQGVPEGFALIPDSITLSYEDIEAIITMTGWDEGRDDFGEGVLWVGTIRDDEGNETYGLNISCIEVMEEGALPVHEFSKPARSSPTWWSMPNVMTRAIRILGERRGF